MAEQQKGREVKVILDNSPQITQANEVIKSLNEQVGNLKAKNEQLEETVKGYMRQSAEYERREVESKMDKRLKPEDYGTETAMLYSEHTLHNVDFENSEILDMMHFGSVEKAIETTEALARKGNPQAKTAMKQLTRKALEKGFDMTFKGSIKDMVKSDVPLSGFDTEFTRKLKEAHNQRLHENRLNWVQSS